MKLKIVSTILMGMPAYCLVDDFKVYSIDENSFFTMELESVCHWCEKEFGNFKVYSKIGNLKYEVILEFDSESPFSEQYPEYFV